MNFTSIDFETANGSRTSACSLGVVVVENSKIVETKYWLIRPQPFEFNYFNVLVNGLTEEMLKDKPLFCDYWQEIRPYIDNKIIAAHNASFDISVLSNTLGYYGLAIPDVDYICSYKASKKVFKNMVNYRLDTIAQSLNINFNHHNALEDAEATAKILMYMAETLECNCIEDFAVILGLGIGRLSASKHIPCSDLANKTTSKLLPLSKRITATVTNFDEDNEFYQKTVVFTGTLTKMTRAQACQIVANLGGYPSDNINKQTDYLVLGIQDYRFLNGHEQSSKTRKAIEYAKKGTGIQIISEEDFYNMIEKG